VLLPQCSFCNHANPAGAKYCNDCGSPLHLKPCHQCDAINDRVASNCYSCGTQFPVLATAPEAASVSPALHTTAPSATLNDDTGFGRGHAPPPDSLAESHDIPLYRPANETVGGRDYTVEVVAREPRSLHGGVASLFSAAQQVVPMHDLGCAVRRRPLPRLALGVVLPATAHRRGRFRLLPLPPSSAIQGGAQCRAGGPRRANPTPQSQRNQESRPAIKRRPRNGLSLRLRMLRERRVLRRPSLRDLALKQRG
jgi:Double zinc ribbon